MSSLKGLCKSSNLQLSPSPFNEQRAFAELERIASFGPRPPGSPALQRTRSYLVTQLRTAGAHVSEDPFMGQTPLGPIPMTNLIAAIPGASTDIVMLAGHYDTKRLDHFIGANDGASSTAFLLEMARVLTQHAHPVTYWLVFFDGEEALKTWTDSDSLYGSRHLAGKLTASGDLKRIRAMILVDMIADRNLHIHRESNSDRQLTNLVFQQAQALSYGQYFLDRLLQVQDDHLPFAQAGVPAVDLIALDYGPFNLYWHTSHDTVDKCSPASLGIVGRVVLNTLAVLEKTAPTQARDRSTP